ncbi:MAG TPA: nucleotidyltransferase family protein [Actinomycetes bacterium]
MSRVAGLVLAAGAGVRFGGPKAVAELAGERLVDRAVRVLVQGGTFPAYVVSGAVELDVPGAVVVPNSAWAEGMGSSLRAGLAAMPEDVDAALVVLVDQPGLTADAVARLVGVADGPGSLAVATYEGRQGHPVVLGRAWWPEVAELAVGDAGARGVLRRHEDRLVRVACGDVATDSDVDRAEDLRRLTEP